MSAYVVSNDTISAIATFADQNRSRYPSPPHLLTNMRTAPSLGAALHAANVAGVRARYPSDTTVYPYCYRHVDAGTVRLEPCIQRLLTPLDLVGLCHCLTYQSCEVNDWDTSDACRFLRDTTYVAGDLIAGAPDVYSAPFEVIRDLIASIRFAHPLMYAPQLKSNRPNEAWQPLRHQNISDDEIAAVLSAATALSAPTNRVKRAHNAMPADIYEMARHLMLRCNANTWAVRFLDAAAETALKAFHGYDEAPWGLYD